MELSKDIKKDLGEAKKTFDRTRERKPEKAKRKFDKAVADLCKKQLRRWERKVTGTYGGLPKRGEPGFSNEAAQELVDAAWAKLRELGDSDLRDAMDRYQAQQGSSPRFDASSEVPRDSGGVTETTAERRGDFLVQTASGRILVGDRFICRKKRQDFAIKSVLKTLIHELMGHWNKNGQKVRVSSQLTPADQNLVRKQRFEKRADNRTTKIWNKLKKTNAFKEFCEELEDAARDRSAAMKEQIKAAIAECLEELEAGE